MDYLQRLQYSYDFCYREVPFANKYDFLASEIFDLTTYDSELGTEMGKACVEVCLAITLRHTFKYIEDTKRYRDYIWAVNLPFFENKLDWGTSIRGAWWGIYGEETFTIESCGLFSDGKQILSLTFNSEQWNEFMKAMGEFVESD